MNTDHWSSRTGTAEFNEYIYCMRILVSICCNFSVPETRKLIRSLPYEQSVSDPGTCQETWVRGRREILILADISTRFGM